MHKVFAETVVPQIKSNLARVVTNAKTTLLNYLQISFQLVHATQYT